MPLDGIRIGCLFSRGCGEHHHIAIGVFSLRFHTYAACHGQHSFATLGSREASVEEHHDLLGACRTQFGVEPVERVAALRL